MSTARSFLLFSGSFGARGASDIITTVRQVVQTGVTSNGLTPEGPMRLPCMRPESVLKPSTLGQMLTRRF